MGIRDFLKTEQETSELHKDGDLRSRYYKTSYKKIKEQVEIYALDNKLNVRNIDDNHGEIYLQTDNYHMILQIVQVNPLETAVDVKVQTYKMIGMNQPKKSIIKLYQFLDSKLQFKGTSLHP